MITIILFSTDRFGAADGAWRWIIAIIHLSIDRFGAADGACERPEDGRLAVLATESRAGIGKPVSLD
jgi:hypothetical protein